jgi:hypothetical protein
MPVETRTLSKYRPALRPCAGIAREAALPTLELTLAESGSHGAENTVVSTAPENTSGENDGVQRLNVPIALHLTTAKGRSTVALHTPQTASTFSARGRLGTEPLKLQAQAVHDANEAVVVTRLTGIKRKRLMHGQPPEVRTCGQQTS